MEITGNTVSYKHSNNDEWPKLSEDTQEKGQNYLQSKPFVIEYIFKFFNDIFEFALFSFKIKIIESSGFGMNEIEASGDLTLENNQELFPKF